MSILVDTVDDAHLWWHLIDTARQPARCHQHGTASRKAIDQRRRDIGPMSEKNITEAVPEDQPFLFIAATAGCHIELGKPINMINDVGLY